MLEEDREAIRKMKADFESLADLADSNFNEHVSFVRRMNHYNTVYTAATRNTSSGSECSGYDSGEVLYMDYQEMLTRYLLRFRDFTASSEMVVFQKVLTVWKRYKILMKWNMQAFDYLSRYYIVNHSKPTLRQVALTIFLEQIFKPHADVVSQVTQELLVKERLGEHFDRSSITAVTDLFSSMRAYDTQSFYMEKFLRPFLKRTRIEYEALIEEWNVMSSADAFLDNICDALLKERTRCQEYFAKEEQKMIMSSIESVLMDSPITQAKLLFSQDGFPRALRTRQEKTLTKYYDFFSHKETGINSLASLVRESIETEGKELSDRFGGEEAAIEVVEYVSSMLKLLKDFQHILATCFQLDLTISKSVREGLENAFSNHLQIRSCITEETRQVSFCELLAHYAGIVIQRQKEPFEEELQHVVSALAYTIEKDRFLFSARERMAERIFFSGKAFNEANERLFIQKIRQRCGAASTAYLEGMLNDFAHTCSLPEIEDVQFLDNAPPFEVSLLVAKKGIWPAHLSLKSSITPPSFVQKALDYLQALYLKGTQRRVLTWSHESCSAELKGTFGSETYILSVSGIQAFILLSFNRTAVCTGSDIMKEFGISLQQFRLSLPPLLKGKVLLRSSPLDHAVEAFQIITVNEDYRNRSRKIYFPPTLARVSIVSSEQVAKHAGEDRKPAIDACLVKILKSHHAIDHEDLVGACRDQLACRFIPDIKLIKQRIEELLQREYIERDRGNNFRYRYLA